MTIVTVTKDSKQEKMLAMDRKQATAVIDRTIGKLISERKKQGLSHETIASMTGLHRSTISLIEARKREATLLTLLRISDALNCDLGKLITSAQNKHQS